MNANTQAWSPGGSASPQGSFSESDASNAPPPANNGTNMAASAVQANMPEKEVA
jgi:hypothetical protein